MDTRAATWSAIAWPQPVGLSWDDWALKTVVQLKLLETTVNRRVEEAPQDGLTYGRQGGSWVAVSGSGGGGTVAWGDITGKPSTFPPDPEAVDDRVAGLLDAGTGISLTYDDAGNALTIASTVTGDALVSVGATPPASPTDRQLWWESDSGLMFLRYNDGNSTQWVQVNNAPNSIILDAPVDGKTYGRQNASWNDLADEFGARVLKAGDTMTGSLTVPYVNVSGYVSVTGTGYLQVITANNRAIDGRTSDSSNGSYAIIGFCAGTSIYGIVGGMVTTAQGNAWSFYAPHGAAFAAPVYYPGRSVSSGTACTFNSNNFLCIQSSSQELKHRIEPMWEEVADKLLQSEPIFFAYKPEVTADPVEWTHYGFTAEAMAALDPRFAVWGRADRRDQDGKTIPRFTITEEGEAIPIGVEQEEELTPQDINLRSIVAGLMNLVQRMDQRIKTLEARVGSV